MSLREKVEKMLAFGLAPDALGSGLENVVLLRGGMINRVARVVWDNGNESVLKWNESAPRGFFAAEAAGLRLLKAADVLRVPAVVRVRERDEEADGDTARASFLLLEAIPVAPPNGAARFARRFGEQLARLHREALAPDGKFGLDRDNFIGQIPQINTPHTRWPDFYRNCRLLPQIELAQQHGRLTPYRERLLMTIVERLETLLDGMNERACLLHGDLWSGNFLSAGDEPVLIDPAAYYGPREMEIAYIELFGGFPDGFLAAYHAAYPLDASYTRRRHLHQLFPLLNHLNHFGETYGSQVDSISQEIISLTLRQPISQD